jgi:hypothetical protein
MVANCPYKWAECSDSALSFWPINIIFGRKHYYTII